MLTTAAESLTSSDFDLVWAPQEGPQKVYIDCPLPEVFFGGSRGGGKTDGVLGKWSLKQDLYGSAFNAIFFRKTMPSADDVVERSKQIFTPLGGVFNEHPKAQWRFPKGGRVRFRPLETVADAEKYQGQNVSDAAVEEAGLYENAAPIDRLHGILRSAAGVPTQLTLTANPGGPGQLWIKDRYIDPAPMGMQVLRRTLPNGSVHKYIYIPSRLHQNQFLVRDKNYVNRLYLVGNAALVKAWLEGDWNAIEGAFFDNWSSHRHVCEPFEIPKHWTRFRSMDWGYAEPFSVGWYAVASEETPLSDEIVLPKGGLIKYREWYGRGDKPNVGPRMNDELIGKGIADREQGEKVDYGVLDPSAFAQRGGPSNAETICRAGKIMFRPADNTRTGPRGHVVGWSLVRHRLDGLSPSQPMIAFFKTCSDTIRTLPTMQHHRDKAEDMDDTAEDHAVDELRYACASRPWIKPLPKSEKPLTTLGDVTLNTLWKKQGGGGLSRRI